MTDLVSQDIHIALIQEPYISKHTNKIPSIPKGYSQYHKGYGSMSAIIIRKNQSHFPLSEFITNALSSVVVQTKEAGKIVISSLYCPRLEPPLCESWIKLQEKTKSLGAQSITGVDSNCHTALVGYPKSDKRAEEWDTFLATTNLSIQNDPGIKTFQNSRGFQSTIDWTVVSPEVINRLHKWSVPDDHVSLSDHKAIFFHLNEDPILADQKTKNFMKTDWTKFRDVLKTNLEKLDLRNSTIETTIKETTKILQETIASTVPKTKKQNYKNKWWNPSLQRSKTDLRRAKRSGINEEYIRMKSKFEEEIAVAKRKSWETFTSTVENRNDAYIRYKILCKKTEETALPSLKIDNKWTNSSRESASELLKTNLPDLPRPLTQEHTMIENEVKSFLEIKHDNENKEPSITIVEVRNAIRDQKAGRAPGLDEIPGIVFKQTIDIISPTLLNIFNMLLTEGKFPATWSKAKIIFIKKPKKPNTDPAAFRPISLLPTIGKLYEKIILERLNWHSRKNELIDKGQFGFQRGVSAEHAGLKLANTVSKAFKTKHEVAAVFCDISKAFPSVFHAGLLKKLIDSKIPIEYIRFMNSYLENQSVEVKVNQEEKIEKSLSRGCPQGSCISPWAWNIMLNDLFPAIRNTAANIQAFADDIVIYKIKRKGQTLEETLGQAMRALEEWGKKWLVKFCPEKTKAMTFSWLRNTRNDTILLEDRELENVKSYKYLGLVFDRRLTWKEHLKHVTSKATRMMISLAPICKTNWGLPSEATKFLYERAILPIILYGSIVWCKTIEQKTAQKELQKVQRIAALCITGAMKTSANDTLNILAGLKPIHLVVAERAAMQLHNILANPELKNN